MSFLTCFWLFPQNEHFSRSPPSPMRATGGHPPIRPGRGPSGYDGWCEANEIGSASRRYPVPPPVGGTDTNCLGENRRPLPGVEHGVDQAVVDGLRGGEDLVALDV